MPRYRIKPSASTIVIEARSSVGPIAWEGVGPLGEFAFTRSADAIETSPPPSGWLELQLESLTSGNKIYDAELLRRVEADRYPTARVELTDVNATEADGVYHAIGRLEFHGKARRLTGDLEVDARGDGTVLVTGAQQVDIRDFGLPAPTMLMLKVYPDVRVHLVVEGESLD